MSNKQHLAVLDGLRGVAALGVMLYHISDNLKGGWFVHGPLAVDFFFVLSGFVVAMAYESRLKSSMTFRSFLAARVQRLYPMVFLGSLAGFAWISVQYGSDAAVQFDAIEALVYSVLLLPLGSFPAGSGAAFSLNAPLWSLFYELGVNLVYASVVRWLNFRVLVIIIAVSACGLILYAAKHNTLNFGWARREVIIASTRVAFGFFMGVLLYRHRRQKVGRSSGITFALILIGVMAVPHTRWDGLFEVFTVCIVFPAMVWLAASTKADRFFERFYVYIGALSYPIYLLHFPVARVALVFQERFSLSGAILGVSIAAEFLLVIGLSHIALRLYDEPIRRWLRSIKWRGSRFAQGTW